jgi:hypothetical protein
VTANTLTDAGLFNVAGGTVTMGGLSLAAAGKVTGFGTFTHAVAGSGTITASGGLLNLSGGIGGTAALSVLAASTLELSGAASTAGTVTDSGVLLLTGGSLTASGVTVGAAGLISGTGTLGGPIANGGQVSASGGLLRLTGAITGAGGLRIQPGATLELGGATAEGVTYGTGTATLQLDAPATFTGGIGGLALGDAITFSGETVSSAVISGTTLTVVGSAGTTHYTVAGALTGNHFAIQTGNHTIVVANGPALAAAPAAFMAPTALAPSPADAVPLATPTVGEMTGLAARADGATGAAPAGAFPDDPAYPGGLFAGAWADTAPAGTHAVLAHHSGGP